MPLRTISNHMKRWRLSYKRPVRKNYKQDKQKVEEFTTRAYPKIVQEAKEENAEILFIDETGISNQGYRISGYSPIGCPPVIESVLHRESVNMISAISSDGKCRYMVYEKSMNQKRFKNFLYLITRAKTSSKIFITTDNLGVNHGNDVKQWVACKKDKIKLLFLPEYSPELNPVEYLNNALKKSVHSGKWPKTKDDIKKLETSCKA